MFYAALLQIWSTSIGSGLPSPSAFLIKRPVRGIMSKVSRLLIIFDYNDDHYAALIKRQQNADMNKDACKSSLQGQL